jgi:hypothetical protein
MVRLCIRKGAVAQADKKEQGRKGETDKWVKGERKNTLHYVFFFTFSPFTLFASSVLFFVSL